MRLDLQAAYRKPFPEHIADRLTQVKDNYANMVEEAVSSERLNTWNRFYGDITDLLRVDPTQRSRPEVLVRRKQGAAATALHAACGSRQTFPRGRGCR